MPTSKLTIILLSLGLFGYTQATNATGSEDLSPGEKANKIELPAPAYSVSSGQLVLSDYFVSRATINASKIFNLGADLLWADLAGYDVPILRFCSEYIASIAIFVKMLEACKREYCNKYQQMSLNRLLILQHFTQRKLDWRLYALAATELETVESISATTEREYLFLLNPIFWFARYALCNYLFRGQVATIIPQIRWDRVAYMPYYWVDSSASHHLDSYISYRDKTVLIGLSTNGDKYSLFCKTDTLCSCRRYILDIEAGVEFDSDPGSWGGVIGLQGKFPLHEHLLLSIALSYQTPGFTEGISAEDGFLLSGGIVVHY